MSPAFFNPLLLLLINLIREIFIEQIRF